MRSSLYNRALSSQHLLKMLRCRSEINSCTCFYQVTTNLMFALTAILIATATVTKAGNISTSFIKDDPGSDQLVLFKNKHAGPIGIMTTSSGAPISYTDATNSLNSRLARNEYAIDSLTHFNRERIPERVVHAKGGGAIGYFEVTHDIRSFCKAEIFSKIGKRTPVAVRFSVLSPERGGSDVTREVRGFSIKFYTKYGNLDIVGLNFPIFVVKDPPRFPNFVRATKRNPSTNLRDNNAFWDFTTLNPETFFHLLYQFGDRGIPASYVNMPGYSIHTYQVENEHGEKYFVRFHFIPESGIKNLTSEEARRIAAEDLDYLNRILYNDIANGRCPSWTVSIQVLTFDDVKLSHYDVFDVTRVIPLDKYPLKRVGKLILDKNPKNYFAEIEQLAFCPGNLIPGILGDPSQLFEARRFLYRDSQYYRLGANYNKISVNTPYRTKTFTYDRDGAPPVNDNEEDIPNYYPNSFNGPVPYNSTHKSKLINIVENPEPNNFEQVTELYLNEMTSDERSRLVTNIVSHLKLSTVVTQRRAVAIFERIHPDLGHRVAQGLKANNTFLDSV